MPQRRAHYAYAVVDTCVKPSLLNPRKYAARVMSEPEAIGFGSSRERFHESHYYLEDGDPGGNRMFAPHVGRSAIRETQLQSDAVAHGVIEHKPTVRGWSNPQDGIKGARGWCGGAHHSSFAPEDMNSVLTKNANLMRMAGNETRLQELQGLRDRKTAQVPGPGSYHVPVDYSLKSYRRPESGGPKDRHNGKTLRELEMELHTKQRNPGILSNGTGPGYYRADIAKDRTQSRRVPQPVTAAFKRATGGRNRAECVSVTMLTGHHWRERVPRLGEGDGEDGGGMGTAWPHLAEEASEEGNGRRLAKSAEYRKVQADLDKRLSQPKVAYGPALHISRVAAPKALLRHERLSSSLVDHNWVDHRSDSAASGETPRSTPPFEPIGGVSPDMAGWSASLQRRMAREELPARAPSAPPQDPAVTQSLESTRLSMLRAEKSDGPASFRGLEPTRRGVVLQDYLLTSKGGKAKQEARRAAERAVLYEQRRTEWQLRSMGSQVPAE